MSSLPKSGMFVFVKKGTTGFGAGALRAEGTDPEGRAEMHRPWLVQPPHSKSSLDQLLQAESSARGFLHSMAGRACSEGKLIEQDETCQWWEG